MGASQFAAGNTAVRPLSKRSNKASSDAGPELAGRESHEAMESPEALMCPLENGISGINKSSSDDRPGPGICDSKYVEDAKAARSVRVWDRVPMKDIGREAVLLTTMNPITVKS